MAVGRHDEGEWRKALALADALSQTDAEILIVSDADVWTDGLPAAAKAVQDGAPWAVPHRGVFRLTEDGTRRYMAGEPLDGLPLVERAYLGVECGGVFVVRREVYEDCPMDPRFTGFGGEDESLSWALRALCGAPWRGKAQLAHLWHPPQARVTRGRGSEANVALRKRYVRARRDPDVMRRLVEEAHDALAASESSHDAHSAV